jgi:acetyl esterase/lipase
MPSSRALLVNFVLRHVVKRRLAACRSPADLRAAFRRTPVLAPRGVRFRDATFGGVVGEWAEKIAAQAEFGAVFYVHGGGYAAMSPRASRSITGGLALRGFRVFATGYRLAPEHRFPAALDDVLAAWRALRAEVEGPILIAGDSSGGGLALALMLTLRDRGERAPSGACLFSPWVDLAISGDSVRLNRDRDPVEAPDCLSMLAAAYAGDADLRTPLVSPIYGDLVNLPPLLIFAGDTEILLDDARRLAERARARGVEVDLRIYPDMPHVWPQFNAVLREGREALDGAADFMRAAGARSLGDWLRFQRASEAAARPPLGLRTAS